MEEQLTQRETALESAMQLAQSLSQNLDTANSRIADLEEEKESLTNHLEACEEQNHEYEATIAQLQKENADYSQQIDSLAETPSTAAELAQEEMAENLNASVPETPSKQRSWFAMGNSSPQKRVEALSIRVEALRAHNTKLLETVAHQEKQMKMQLDEATQNEMKWKAVAKAVQQDLEEREEELDAQKLAGASLRGELESTEQLLASLSGQTERLSSAEGRIEQLTVAMAALEQAKASAEQGEATALRQLEAARSAQAELEKAHVELEQLRSSQKQSEDDLRLIYLQHKQDRADLEAIYKHEDYKTRYHEAVQRAAVLHQRLSHVLQFIATNQALAKLASETIDHSAQQPLKGAWMSNFMPSLNVAPHSTYGEEKGTSSPANAVSTPVKSTPMKKSTLGTPRTKIASSSPYASPAAPMSATKRRVGKTPGKMAVHTRVRSVDDSPSNQPLVVNDTTSSSLAMTQSLIEAYRAWKVKCEQMGARVIALETVLVRERQSRLDAVAQLTKEHDEALQNNLDALHISHDAQVERCETELEMQRFSLEAQTEAFQSLHAAYLQLVEESNSLRMQVHVANCDLLTYRSVYEEAKAVEAERVDLEKRVLQNAVDGLHLELTAQRAQYEARIEALETELQEKEQAICFLDQESKAEDLERKQLIEQHSMRVFELETQVETQQLHIEEQDVALRVAKHELARQREIAVSLASQLTHQDAVALTLAVVLQRTTTQAAAVDERLQTLEARLQHAEEENADLQGEIAHLDVMFGRAKGNLIAQSFEVMALKETLERQRGASQEACAELEADITAKEVAMADLVALNGLLTNDKQAYLAQSQLERDTLTQELSEKSASLEVTLARLDRVSESLDELNLKKQALQEEMELVKATSETEKSRLIRELEESSETLAAIKARQEALLSEQKEALAKEEAMKVVMAEMSATIESVMRESLMYRSESEKLSKELEQLKQDMERVEFEKERNECELERKAQKLAMAEQSNATLESSRDQLEVVVKRLEASQTQMQEANAALEQSLAHERDEMEKLYHRIGVLQEELSAKLVQLTQLEQQRQASSSLRTSGSHGRASLVSSQQLIAPQGASASGSFGADGNAAPFLVTEEMEAMLIQHHEWLQSMRDAFHAYLRETHSQRVDLDQECASLSARVVELENLVHEREEERDRLLEQVSRHANDLLLAKNSHRTLILQNGMLSSLIAIAQTSEGLAQEIKKAGTASSTGALLASSSTAVMSKDQISIADKQERMKLERQCQSLLLKNQRSEDENRALKLKLDESKLELYIKGDSHQAQLKAYMQRFKNSIDDKTAADNKRLHLVAFICQIRDSLIRLAHIPAVRELLVIWTPMLSSLQQTHLTPNEEQ